MPLHMVLASGSAIRAELLRRARIDFEIVRPRVDEASVTSALLAEEATPRDVADSLAEMKSRKVSEQKPGALVLGCDQVLDLDRQVLSKPSTEEECREQLAMMSGRQHKLLSAAVICQDGQPIWRHVGIASLRMHRLSDGFIRDYVARNWEEIRHCVGGYQLEDEGVRLFTSVEGDFFHVLGLPLLEILGFLVARGELEM